MQKKLRKCQSSLEISGMAVIAFGLWGVIKLVLLIVFLPQYIDINDPESQALVPLIRAVFFIILALVLVELALRVYIGLTARAEGRGKKKRIIYLILTGILIAFSVYTIISSSIMLIRLTDFIDFFFTLIVDLTSLLALVELFVSSIQVKRYRKLTEA